MWDEVEKATRNALLISWDSCHKIYLSMDAEQAAWFEKSYTEENNSVSFRGTPEEMFEKLEEWWDVSCSLRFISAVWTDNDNPNNGFISLIPQFAEV
jgi:hypothetical protein